ncbi:hypothetical protein HNY73_020101 [Argiope bruennichi]|uniref:Uncharacterized protein n=1 Tax=Argiope bruennichi TaxID=94029 RepID=A0A8T0E6X5_ARGBR|nr:hypothetical protein HNY73_020101 [Argiope bruennichi]
MDKLWSLKSKLKLQLSTHQSEQQHAKKRVGQSVEFAVLKHTPEFFYPEASIIPKKNFTLYLSGSSPFRRNDTENHRFEYGIREILYRLGRARIVSEASTYHCYKLQLVSCYYASN